jgi:large subunit ribosomal protein L30
MLDGMLEEQSMGVPIKVKLVRSPIGRPEKHRRVLQGLGLSYVNKVVDLYSTPQVLGAIRKVQHLLEVSEQQGQ